MSNVPREISPLSESKFEKLKVNLLNHYDRFIFPRLGIVFALLSQFFGSIMVLSSKLLEQDTDFAKPLDPFEVIFIRMLLTSLVTAGYFLTKEHKESILGPPNLRWALLLRGLTGFTGIYTLYWSIQYISISTNTVIGFLNPVLTVFLAFMVLGEKYTIFEGIGGTFSIIGVMLVVQPTFLFPNPLESDNSGVESADPHLRALGVIVALFGCFTGAISSITLRFIGKRCDPVISVQWMSVISMIFSFFGLVYGPGSGFQMLTTFRQVYLFVQLGISGFLTQFLWTCGIAREKAGRIVLLSYFGMIYSIFWEYVFWGHAPSLLTWCGFLIVVLSTAGIIYLKPNEAEMEVVNLALTDDDEERAKFDVEMEAFTIDDDDDDETLGSSLNSVRSKI